jgi:hypothetical protein
VNFRCARCGKMVSNPVWLMWNGRLVRVGQDCAEAIRGEQSPDAVAGMAWWNALTPGERVYWMDAAGNTGIAADAWAAFKRARSTSNS